jgi:cytochrome c oxidase assembly factor CtaG
MVGEMVSQVAAHSAVPVLMVADAPLWSRRVLAIVEPQGDAETAARLAADLAALAQAPLTALVLCIDAAQIAHGRLAAPVEALIGALACPTALVVARAASG